MGFASGRLNSHVRSLVDGWMEDFMKGWVGGWAISFHLLLCEGFCGRVGRRLVESYMNE